MAKFIILIAVLALTLSALAKNPHACRLDSAQMLNGKITQKSEGTRSMENSVTDCANYCRIKQTDLVSKLQGTQTLRVGCYYGADLVYKITNKPGDVIDTDEPFE